MVKTSPLFTWAGVVTGVIVATLLLGKAAGNRPFHPNLECAGCHLAGQGTTEINAAQLTASQEVLCGQCHRGALELSHPTGFRPARLLPADYPLDWKGDMTCGSCHDIHQGKAGLVRGDKTGKALCLSCHEERFFVQMADKGVSLQRLGHLSAKANPLKRELDPYSIQCLDCHVSSGDAPRVRVDSGGVLRHTGGVNHPIGIDYEKASRSGLYKAFSRLHNDIKLPDGKVSCVSCHAGYSKQHGALVMSNRGSALCLECHDL